MEKVILKVDWATHDAVVFACTKWHYSKCVPVGKLVKIGVWENKEFKGVLIFSRGANKDLLKPFGLKQTEGCELTRVALGSHVSPVSRILSIGIKLLKKLSPDLKLIVSFADMEQNHHGGIYQACNWIYAGMTLPADEYLYKGKRWHGRAFRKCYGSHKNFLDKGLKIIKGSSKHRYLFALDPCLKPKINVLAKQYPKRAQSKESVASAIHAEESGANPTSALI